MSAETREQVIARLTRWRITTHVKAGYGFPTRLYVNAEEAEKAVAEAYTEGLADAGRDSAKEEKISETQILPQSVLSVSESAANVSGLQEMSEVRQVFRDSQIETMADQLAPLLWEANDWWDKNHSLLIDTADWAECVLLRMLPKMLEAITANDCRAGQAVKRQEDWINEAIAKMKAQQIAIHFGQFHQWNSYAICREKGCKSVRDFIENAPIIAVHAPAAIKEKS